MVFKILLMNSNPSFKDRLRLDPYQALGEETKNISSRSFTYRHLCL